MEPTAAQPPEAGFGGHDQLHLLLSYRKCATFARGKFMDAKTIQAIEAILKRGNDAKVRKKGSSYVVIEVKETIKYSPTPIVAREGQ